MTRTYDPSKLSRPLKLRGERHFGNRIVSCYADRPANIWEMVSRPMIGTPAVDAVVEDERRITYEELRQSIETVATNLQALGVQAGDRVATLLGNRSEFIVIILACARMGAIVVPMGIRLKAPEVEHMLVDSGAKLLVHESSLADLVPAQDRAPDLQARFSIPGASPGSRDFADLLSPRAAVDWPSVDEEALFAISYTSGTTGKPKGATITHLGVVNALLNYHAVLGLEGPETTLMAAPGNHIGGLIQLIQILELGGRLVLMKEFKARQFLELADAERMTYGGAVPAMYNLLLRDPEFDRFDLSSWRWAIYSGAPMPEATIRAFGEMCPHAVLINCYGATEATTVMTIMPPGFGLERSYSVGATVPCVEILVVDDQDREVPRGEAGELLVRGPSVVPGYWNNPTGTEASFVGGYWRSGDIGSFDEDGFLRILDRKKDMINRGGMKVFAAEVENVLNDHPDVLEAAVVGKPDSVLGERVHAFVVPRSPQLAIGDIVAFCAERMADYKVPEGVTLLDTPLPRNPTGKIMRPPLVAALQQEEQR